MKLPGVPEGYRPLAYKKPEPGELFLGENGEVFEATDRAYTAMFLVIEKVEPLKVPFWVAKDGSGEVYLYSAKPEYNYNAEQWNNGNPIRLDMELEGCPEDSLRQLVLEVPRI